MALTVYAGQNILADDLNNLIPIAATKAATTSRTSLTTVAADPDLFLPLAANATYDLELLMLITSATNAAGDFLWDLAWTGSALVDIGFHALHNTIASGSQADLEGAGVSNDSSSPTAAFVAGASTSTTAAFALGTIATTTAVVLTLEWAQFSSNVSATSLLAGSRFVARRRT